MNNMVKYFKRIKTLFISLIVCMPFTVSAAIDKVTCGYASSNYLRCVPKKIPSLTSKAFLIVQVIVPIVIILFGSIDLVKAMTAGKEEDIKKAQSILVKRLITGAIVFFVFVVVKLLVNIVETNSKGIIDCMNCFINDKCRDCK